MPVVIDVAVPRDVDPAARELPGVTVLDMDEVSQFVQDAAGARQREADKTHRIVDDAVTRFLREVAAREVAPLVATLHEQAEGVRAAELDRAAARLAAMDDHQRDVVEALTKSIVAKLLHNPSVRLKEAAGTARGDGMAESLRDLLDL